MVATTTTRMINAWLLLYFFPFFFSDWLGWLLIWWRDVGGRTSLFGIIMSEFGDDRSVRNQKTHARSVNQSIPHLSIFRSFFFAFQPNEKEWSSFIHLTPCLGTEGTGAARTLALGTHSQLDIFCVWRHQSCTSIALTKNNNHTMTWAWGSAKSRER